MNHDEYAARDALGLAECVRKGEVTPAELLALAQARCAAVNPRINAVTIPMPEQAQAHLKAGFDGPFAGVPFLIKDIGQEYQGVATTLGSRAYRRPLAESDLADLLAYYRDGADAGGFEEGISGSDIKVVAKMTHDAKIKWSWATPRYQPMETNEIISAAATIMTAEMVASVAGSAGASHGQSAQNVAVVINDASPASVRIGEHYKDEDGNPAVLRHVLGLAFPLGARELLELLGAEQLAQLLVAPLCLRQHLRRTAEERAEQAAERELGCQNHGGDDQHAEEDDFLHPFVIDLTAAFDIAVPMIDILGEIERTVAGGTHRHNTQQHRRGNNTTTDLIHHFLLSSE